MKGLRDFWNRYTGDRRWEILLYYGAFGGGTSLNKASFEAETWDVFQ